MKLDNLAIGKSAVIVSVGGTGALRQHFLDMGLIQGVEVTMVKYAPMGDPIEIKIHDYELTLRKEDAQKIEVKEITKKEELKNENIIFKYKKHPGYGESSYDKINNHQIYHESDLLTFALVGNQNCGKTTLFNQLTGSNQHVGNFPGVTVDRKDGVIKGYKNTLITDLPGIYSMSPYSSEEIVTRNFLLKEKPKAIINIVDATNIERNLYLTMQLLELNMPMVVALNMMDEMSGNGGTVLINELEDHLGVPVVPISAAKGEGIDELVSHVLHVAYYQEKPQFLQYFDNQALDRCINAIEHLIEDHTKKARVPLRFAASKLAENDSLLLEQLDLSQNEKEILEHIRKQLEEESSLDCSAAIASDRFHSIINICRQTVKKPHESKERLRSQKIDQFLTGKYTGIPAFIGIMGIVFFLTFNVIGSFLQGILENGVSIVTNYVDTLLTQAQINVALHSLIIDGIFNGVGTVLSFLPIIVTLFFFLSILEDSGYMARVAFIMDKLLRKIGISVEDIKSVLNDNVTLENCLEKYLDVLEKQKSNLTKMYNLTEEIINQKCELNNLKTDEWLEKMENMEKEGIDFVNISKIDIHMKKKMGAIIGGAVMIVFMIFLIGMFLWGNSVDPIPLGLLIVLVAIPVVIIVCIIGVLIGRIREIDGGEEDEAAKY